MSLDVFQYEYGSDNYGVLLHDVETNRTAAIDAGDADALLDALNVTGWDLTDIWITHHHYDHVMGLQAVKKKTGCHVIGPAKGLSTSIEGVDQHLGQGDYFMFGNHKVEAIHTPGHTLDMINYYIPNSGLLFTGDTLFSLGCGRVFEGDPVMMWDSLLKLKVLPKDTQIYCGHEYTTANAEFATVIDPDNPDLAMRIKEVKQLRGMKKPTIPATLGLELKTNPFLRVDNQKIRQRLGMNNATDQEVFAEIRSRKDSF